MELFYAALAAEIELGALNGNWQALNGLNLTLLRASTL